MQVTNTEWEVSNNSVSVAATYISPTEVVCNLPNPTNSYQILVGFTGQPAALSVITILNYDSICFSCDFVTGDCSRTVSEAQLLCDSTIV